MEKQIITEETLERIKSMPRIDYDVYKELIALKQVVRVKKLKHKRTIFVDEENGCFYYLNPVWQQLHKCGEFVESEVINV